ncbi:MAG TPA: hypothetical protein VIJ12_04805 [Candidatus Baltobacteraceae bacterium]
MKLALPALAVLLLAPAAAGAAGQCSRETLAVPGSPVTVSYCVAGAPSAGPGDELLVPVSESYSAPGGSYADSATLHFLTGESASRQIAAVDLTRLGSTGTLHLTLVYHGGLVSVESAILTPGAIKIK